ncbi:uncharacterized protein LOC143887942 [Tasmannia lanceolata]|uniref:uncharacterized protein LOC143887942 n=1 Tax=Tasmannia lanceolata TaxID=3420 RepID=UPI004063FC1B
MKSEWDVKLSYRKALITKGIMLNHFHGNFEDSYRILPTYALEFYRANHGSHMYVYRLCDLCDREENSFCRLFWTIGPRFRAWNRSLRPLVTIDCTHLRVKYVGILLIACSVDGDNQILPIAYTVVEGEEFETWSWFLYHLRMYVMASNRRLGKTFCSDQQKCLMKAVRIVFPESFHMYCIRHLQTNLYDKFKDAVCKDLLWIAATALRKSEFREYMGKIEENNKVVYEWLMKIPKEHWGGVYFRRKIYNVYTSNGAEVMNFVLREARTLSIATLVEYTQRKASETFHNHRSKSNGWTNKLTSYALRVIQLGRERGRRMLVLGCDMFLFEVKSKHHQDSVDLQARTCICGEFQNLGIPCDHAMAAIGSKDLDPYDFTSACYYTETLCKTYKESRESWCLEYIFS